jgi:hypothetical protein
MPLKRTTSRPQQLRRPANLTLRLQQAWCKDGPRPTEPPKAPPKAA